MTLYRWMLVALTFLATHSAAAGESYLATFTADVTIPLGHRCMGVLETKAERIVDPLFAKGFVLQTPDGPIVVVSVDWCEIRNGAYERWREVLADAAQTTPERVLVSSIHQHDAPVVDLDAERILAEVGLAGELCDVQFHETTLQRVASALREGLKNWQPVTHLGLGQARVERIASNRRVVRADGPPVFHRGSNSGGDQFLSGAPDGLIDPWLKTISFWNNDQPLAAIHSYATHPMSYYGRGDVSADFVGMARRRMQEQHPTVLQIYASGCSGDVTAGKYNDASEANRPLLADRLYQAMQHSWRTTKRHLLERSDLRIANLTLEFNDDPAFTTEALQERLQDDAAKITDRVYAAMGLASRERLNRPVDVPCVDFGVAQLVLFPGESFVGYQLMAQRMRSDCFVFSMGYGECWPGYVPTAAAFADGFGHSWRWVAPSAQTPMRDALWQVLPNSEVPDVGGQLIANDVYPATKSNPRFSEGSVIPLADDSLLYATTEFVDSGSDFAKASIVAKTSQDGGRTWGSRRVLQENIGGLNVMSVSLRRFRTQGASGIGMFYLVKNSHDDLDVYLRLSSDEAVTFGEPILVTHEPGYHVMNNDRVTQLTDGRLICPIASTSDVTKENHFVSFCYFSDDGGQTWRAGQGRVDLPRRGAMEPEVVELKDGRLLMIVRTQFPEIHASYSTDRGDTWSEPKPWGVGLPEAPATLRRIPSTGDLLLVWNPNYVEGADHGGPRTPLVAAISRDDGKTWSEPRILEDRDDQTYAYTSLTFHGDRALMSYYVGENETGQIFSRFRSLPLSWFYSDQ